MNNESFRKAQTAWDHMEEPYNDREDWAYEQITEALYGDEQEYKKMLKFLEVTEEEYREEYLGNPEALAEEYISVYLNKRDRLDEEYNAMNRIG